MTLSKLSCLALRASTTAIATTLIVGQTAYAKDATTAASDDGNATQAVAQSNTQAARVNNPAQASAPAQPEEQAIIVTAQKVRQNVNDIGMSINVLSGNQLKALAIRTPDDLTKVVPSFTSNLSASGTPIYTLRGVGFYDIVSGAPPSVSVYLDEVPLPYPDMTRGVARDVQRVEVLKGPQGTLFGQNSTGGAINFIANRPTKDFETGGTLEFSSYNKVDAEAFVSGPLTDTLRVRASGSITDGGAWQKSFTRDDHLGATRLTTGRVLADWEATNRLKFQFNVNGWVDHSDVQAGQALAIISAKTPPPALVSLFNLYPHPPTDAREADWDPGIPNGANDTIHGVTHDGFRRDGHFYQLAGRADYDFGGNTVLTSITAYDHLNLDQLIDGDGTNANVYNTSQGAKIETFSQEVRLAGHGGGLQWLIGGNYQHDHVYNFGDTFSTIGTFPFRAAGSVADQRIRSLAAFANLTYSITPNLDLIAGIRYTDVRIDNLGCTLDGGDGVFAGFIEKLAKSHGVNISLAPGSCVTLDPVTFQPTGMLAGKLDEHNVPFRFGFNWKVAPNSLLYVSASKGYKQGTFSPVGALFAPSLDPAKQESLMAYEAGFKLGLLDRVLQLNGAVFRYNYGDKQVRGRILDPVLGSLNKTINVPSSRINGAEIEATVRPDHHLSFDLGASYTDAKINSHFVNYTYGSVLKDMIGTPLPLTPKFQLTLGGNYDAPISGHLAGFAGFNLSSRSKSYSGLGGEELFAIRGYTNLDLRAGVRSQDDRWQLTFFVNNVTNTYSWNFVAISGPDITVRLANQPRIFGLRLSVHN